MEIEIKLTREDFKEFNNYVLSKKKKFKNWQISSLLFH